MGGTTPNTKIPYPVGTDRVMDGDNAIQAVAERVEAAYPYGWRFYGTHTTVQALNQTHAALTGLSGTLTIPAGRRYKITLVVPYQSVYASAIQLAQRILYDGTAIATTATVINANAQAGHMTLIVLHAPASGSHTYSATAAVTSAGNASTWVNATDQPGVLIVEDVGPATLS